MEVKNVVRRGCSLKAEVYVSQPDSCYSKTTVSPEYTIHGLVTFQIKVVETRTNNGTNYNNVILVKFDKTKQERDLTFHYKFSSTTLNIGEKCFKSDDTTWRSVYDVTRSSEYYFDISIFVEIIDSTGSFAELYDDNELIDFGLQGVDGAVRVHKLVLMASSPVLRGMIEGEWQETKEGMVKVEGISQKTLQGFKDYLYLKKLPETGLEQLLLLAVYYIMPELEQKCIAQLMTTINVDNMLDMSEFALVHKLTRLNLAIFECFEIGTVTVEKMRDSHLRGKI